MTTYRVTTTVHDANGNPVSDPTDLDGTANRRRDRLDAIRLRDAYVMSLAAGSATGVSVRPVGSSAYAVTLPDGVTETVNVHSA